MHRPCMTSGTFIDFIAKYTPFMFSYSFVLDLKEVFIYEYPNFCIVNSVEVNRDVSDV